MSAKKMFCFVMFFVLLTIPVFSQNMDQYSEPIPLPSDSIVIEGGEEITSNPSDCQNQTQQTQAPYEPYVTRDQLEKHVQQGGSYGDGKAQEWEAKYRQPVTYKTEVTQVIKQSLSKEELASLERASLKGALDDAKATRNKDGTWCIEMKKYPELGFFVLTLIEKGNASVTSDGKVQFVESGDLAADTLAIESARERRGHVLQKVVEGLRESMSDLKKQIGDISKNVSGVQKSINELQKGLHDVNIRVDKLDDKVTFHLWWLIILTIILLWPPFSRWWQNRSNKPPKPTPAPDANKKQADPQKQQTKQPDPQQQPKAQVVQGSYTI